MKSLWVFGLFIIAVGTAQASVNLNARANTHPALRPFTTDGCTDFPEGTSSNPSLWKKCCTLHDLSYWAGGTKTEFKATDLRLRDCVAATGQTAIAEMMYLGVRLGHLAPQGIRGKQWGNAWSETVRRDSPLSAAEINAIEHELSQASYDSVLEIRDRSAFIQHLRQTR